MNSITIHSRSLFVGLALGAVALLSIAQALSPTSATVRAQYMPHPRDMVQIAEGTPFTVPAGKIFVLTALGSASGQVHALGTELTVDGTPQSFVWSPYPTQTVSAVCCVQPVAPGMSVQPGGVVEVRYGDTWFPDDGRAWGYVVDQ